MVSSGNSRTDLGISWTRGLYCAHPHWPQYHLDFTYQQNYVKGQEPLTLDKEADQFFKGISFTSVRPVAANEPEPTPPSPDQGAGADLVAPQLVKDQKPVYTPEALEAKIEGTVRLEFVFEIDGTVDQVIVVRSLDKQFGLDDAAVRGCLWRRSNFPKQSVSYWAIGYQLSAISSRPSAVSVIRRQCVSPRS